MTFHTPPDDHGTAPLSDAVNDSLGPPAPVEVTGAVTVPYDPTRTRENFRGLIAFILIGLMTAIIIATFALFWLHPDRAASLKDLFTLIFGPVVALVGSATGFYFGTQSADRN